MNCKNCGKRCDYDYCPSCDEYTEDPNFVFDSIDSECENCGEPCKHGICECCDYIRNNPEYLAKERDYIFWRSVEIEAMEQAAEQNLFRCREKDLNKGIQKANRKLKKRSNRSTRED